MRPDASPGGDGAGEIEAILSSYGDSTEELLSALRRGDEEAVLRALEARGTALEAYHPAVKARNRAARTPDAAFLDRVRWHHLRIEELEIEIHRLLKGFRNEVERELGRIRKGRKTRDAYAALPHETSRIVNGEG